MSLLYTTEYSTSRAAGRNKAYIKNHGVEASRSFATWTATEDIELLAEVTKDRLPINQIALLHKRTIRAIEMRLQLLKIKSKA